MTAGATLAVALLATAAPAFAGSPSSSPRGLITLGTRVVFLADDGTSGEELWSTNGTTVSLVKDFNEGADSSGAIDPWKAGSQAFLTAFDGTDLYLWRTDGTGSGTRKLSKRTPVGTPAVAGGRIYYAAADAAHGTELWTSDGTAAGTVRLTDIRPGADGGIYPYAMARLGKRVVFSGNDPDFAADLWIAGPTPGSAKRIKNLDTTATIDWMRTVGDEVWFEVQHVPGTFELWKTDGTKAGTVKIKTLPSNADHPTVVGSSLFFQAGAEATGPELWRSKGTAATTTLVKDITPGPDGSYLPFAMAVGDRLIFVADDSNDNELWRSDGTKSGTVRIKNINPTGPSNAIDFTVIGARAYFFADDGVHGVEPWRSDGTKAGTVMIEDVNPGVGSSTASDDRVFAKLGTHVYFSANDGTHGTELWRTTSGGAALWADIRS